MVKNGRTSAGKQRWKCKQCCLTKTKVIDSRAKRLEMFLEWLMSKSTQEEMGSSARTFRRKTSEFWDYWALPPLIDEIHRVVYIDGIHLGRRAVILIACTDDHVLGWYLARHEHSGAWANLMRRIAPPDMAVGDGGQGFQKALRRIWPDTKLQRCTFHAYSQVRRLTTRNPRLPAGREILSIARELLRIEDREQVYVWLRSYFDWLERYEGFLEEKSLIEGAYVYTHERLRRARSSLNRLINSGHLFTYLDEYLTLGGPLPSTNNRIEGGINSQLRAMLREHRGLCLTRRIKAVFWWCYLKTECPLGAADILKVMPTDDDIDAVYNGLNKREQLSEDIPKWGDAVMWSELHHIDKNFDAFRHDWD